MKTIRKYSHSSRTLRSTVVMALPVLAFTMACGAGGGSDTPVASARKPAQGQDTGTGGTTSGDKPDEHALMLKWIGCMRTAGVKMADPKPDEGPDTQSAYRDAGEAAFMKAKKTCEKTEAQWMRAAEANRPADSDAKDRDSQLKYARCMRENGMKDWPDPRDGRLFPEGANADDVLADPAFQKADPVCQKRVYGK
ncbi:hypothetical protein ABT160_07655 [Streptomyces sp. NPDC001941]|uniref:hypothetical protein n=1 Tax=Streptomyces sp. NPDC001941 TaxID=3154659 RepID=UPI003326DE51